MNTTLKLVTNTDESRLSDAVYETLLEAVLAGHLAAGTIVSEVSLAKQLEVSRTPVHDALKQLAKDGLVAQRANRRAVVTAFSRDDVLDIFDMRRLLEGEAARRAADRIDRPTLARLRATGLALAADLERPDWVTLWADFDQDFHASIAAASGSARLQQDISRYRLLHRGFNKLSTTPALLVQALQEHLRILDALDARDGDRARLEMETHIREWQAYFANHFVR